MNAELQKLIIDIYLRSFMQNRFDSSIPVMSMSECKTLAEEILTNLEALIQQ